jgi:uncharacterized protein YneF (UPF0154 family)
MDPLLFLFIVLAIGMGIPISGEWLARRDERKRLAKLRGE